MGLADFVAGGFPLPQSSVRMPAIYDGMGDFVCGGFPLPQTPVRYIASADGSLPKAPDLVTADLAPIPSYDTPDCGGGMGCGCGGTCGGCGMGALTGDTIIPQASLPSFLQGDALITGFPTLYLVAGGFLAAFFFMNTKKGRR